MELSLFAEAFSEMLSRDYGEIILAALYKERCVRASYVLCHVVPTGGPYFESVPSKATDPVRAQLNACFSRQCCKHAGRRLCVETV